VRVCGLCAQQNKTSKKFYFKEEDNTILKEDNTKLKEDNTKLKEEIKELNIKIIKLDEEIKELLGLFLTLYEKSKIFRISLIKNQRFFSN